MIIIADFNVCACVCAVADIVVNLLRDDFAIVSSEFPVVK